MFKNNDKSFLMVRKFVNVLCFALMCVAVIVGIIFIATSTYMYESFGYSYTGIDFAKVMCGVAFMTLGPVIIQCLWLLSDYAFNKVLDIKIIRNAICGASIPEMPAALFHGKKKASVECKSFDVFEQLKTYRSLLKEGILNEQEYEEIKNELLGNNVTKTENEGFELNIEKIKKLKTYLDEGVLSEDEFVSEKGKIINKQ